MVSHRFSYSVLGVAVGLCFGPGCVAADDTPADAGYLAVEGDSLLESALELSKKDILACRTVKAGGVGFVPGGAYDGIWLTDSTFLLEAYRLWGPQYGEFLYSRSPGGEGIVRRFASVQAADGLIPMVFWGERGEVDYGGRYDLAQNRKQNRDMESPYTFIHINYIYWKDTGDLRYVREYRSPLRRALEPIERRRDPQTGLILATYGPPNCDVSVDFATPQTTAHPYFNALYAEAYREYAEIAAVLGDAREAELYRDKARALRDAINEHLWIASRQRYETRILRTPVTTDTELPAYGINEDRRFPVVDNMLLLYYGIPESRRRVDTLVSKIEASEKHLALAGQMVEPPYPDGFISRASTLFDGGRYHNGDVWTWFSNRYVTALYRLGYSERAERHLRAQARAAVRDGGFSEYYEDDAEGAAKGNFHYSPTAATFQLAMVEGLFGVRWDAPSETLFVHPSVRQSSRLHLRLGGQPVTVRIDLADDSKSICIEIDAKRRARGEFRVLLPEVPGDGWRVFQRTSGERKLVSASILDLGKNRYLVFKAVLPPGREVFDLVNE